MNSIKPFVAASQENPPTIAGFIELLESNAIDCIYVHPDFARQGVANQLYQHVEAQALKRGMQTFLVDAC
ncbi:MAG: GNAT family N-acetyltransferase [Pseudomonadales bacterium]|nr:GNAT family N-acetyltransferase [Pseudomonadales bacterium]